ncbi:unnamed protein product [Rangifer tarandus platyrhynchus]|uniref:Uncharacterized protein n=1 Tax=Rangifer tarandus platyrhynchus TaxID=3082113 RepID=A0ABN8ZN61_RANTA|nr:unnamed protein product [Rangifer tarandus platyrhynchus]
MCGGKAGTACRATEPRASPSPSRQPCSSDPALLRSRKAQPARTEPGELGAGRGRGRPAPHDPPSKGLRGVGPRFGPSVPAASAIHSLAKDASGELGGRAGVTTLSGLGREGPGRGPDAAVTTLPGPAHSPRPPPPGCAAPAPAPSLSPRTLFRPPSTLQPPRLYDGGRQADATSPEASMTVEGRAPQHASAVAAPAR